MSLLLLASLGISTAIPSLRGLLYLLECSPEGHLVSSMTILALKGVLPYSKIFLATLNTSPQWLRVLSCSKRLIFCVNNAASKMVDLTLYSIGWVEARHSEQNCLQLITVLAYTIAVCELTLMNSHMCRLMKIYSVVLEDPAFKSHFDWCRYGWVIDVTVRWTDGWTDNFSALCSRF